MTGDDHLTIRPFQPSDQAPAKALILDGLVEHWGWRDPTKNPDLADIAEHYGGETFLVALNHGALVGTGALIHEAPGAGRVVRMSVARGHRRQGIGRAILYRLFEAARDRGYSQVVVETTSSWEDAKAFYVQHGFRRLGEWDGDTHFVVDLAPAHS